MLPQHEIDTVGQLMDLLHTGDAGVDRVIRDAADLVGQTVAATCLLVAPERVIVVGAMARAGAAVLEPIREALERQTIPQTHAAPEVVQGELGSLHTAKGAVALTPFGTRTGLIGPLLDGADDGRPVTAE